MWKLDIRLIGYYRSEKSYIDLSDPGPFLEDWSNQLKAIFSIIRYLRDLDLNSTRISKKSLQLVMPA